MTSTIRAACAATLIAFAVCPTIVGHAQPPATSAAEPGAALTLTADGPFDTTWEEQFQPLFHALVRLPAASLKDAIEMVLRRRRIPFELRGTSAEEICYEVKLGLGAHTDKASEALMALKSAQPINVKWEQKKDTK